MSRGLVIAIAVAAMLTVAGCGADDVPAASTSTTADAGTSAPAITGVPARGSTSAAGSAPSELAGVDTSSSRAVAEAVITTMFSVDATRDSTPNQAALRAAPLLSAQYIEALKTSDGQRTDGPLWAQWQDRGVRTTVTMAALTHTQRPPDTAHEAFPSYRIIQQPIAANGERLEPIQSYIFLFLEHDTTGWKVTNLVQQK
ncbi:hypothetical protein GS504_01000 [Rhodococcus hoagii]|nr:hypothetical protein [Prescottella equi]NKS72181.1 hypothetical protein [Prescottella equi]